jgi:signal transduction histidine kinase
LAFHKRSIYLINPRFQIRFCLFVALIVFVSSIIYPFTIYEVIDSFIEYLSASSPNAIPQIKENRQKLIVILSLWQLGFTALIFVICIFISHKIAGPIYKIKKHLASMREGLSHGKLYLRKGDYFHELADEMNETFSYLEERQKKDLVFLNEVNEYIKNLKMIVPENKQSVLEEISKRLSEMQDRSNVEN